MYQRKKTSFHKKPTVPNSSSSHIPPFIKMNLGKICCCFVCVRICSTQPATQHTNAWKSSYLALRSGVDFMSVKISRAAFSLSLRDISSSERNRLDTCQSISYRVDTCQSTSYRVGTCQSTVVIQTRDLSIKLRTLANNARRFCRFLLRTK